MAIALRKIYPECQTDESNLNNADKRVAEPSRGEFLGIK